MKIKNGYINNRIRMNLMIKNGNKANKNKSLKRNNSSQRYLSMYENENYAQKSILTPDNGKKIIKKFKLSKKFGLENNLKDSSEQNINYNSNITSNSIDISKSLVNIEDYINLYYNSKNNNPFIIKANDKINEERKEKIIAKYTYKNKKWILIEEVNEFNKIYWKECSDNYEKEIENPINKEIFDFNKLEEKYNSLILEYNKIKQMFNDLNTKYEQLNKKYKKTKEEINYYTLKIKELEKDKEKYFKKNIKLKDEISKIPSLIKEEMTKFREDTGVKLTKRIYELEQENRKLRQEKLHPD